MSPLVLLPLFAAAVLAAPGGIHHQLPASTSPLAVGVVAAPAVPAVAVTHAVAQPAAVVQQHHIVATPQVVTQHVSVPLTKTVHYETRPVVTGYSSSIIKPAIPHFSAPALQAFSVQQHVAAAPIVQQHVAAAPIVQQHVAAAPIVQQNVVAHPAGDAEIIEARAAVAAPQVASVVSVRAPQAGDFGPLVTKEQVLAPVRTHTQIIPQITQVQPEVTVRKVVHDVAVATPVAVQTPVHVQVAQPVVHGYAAHTNVISGHQFVGHTGHQFVGHAGQYVL